MFIHFLKSWKVLILIPLLWGCEDEPVTFSTGGIVNTLCSKEFSVDFRFILDTTTSMQFIFPVIKSNAETFSEQITTSIQGSDSKASFRFGLSTFNESGSPIHLSYKPLSTFTSDIDLLTVQEVTSNLDFPENGIQAMETLLDKPLEKDHLQIVFFVSDNLAHRGGNNFQRDFSMATLLSKVQSQSLGNPLLLFDATPNNNDNDPFYSSPNPVTNQLQTLPDYARTPAEQWDYLRETSNGKIIGQSFGFPLNSSTLNEQIPVYLAQYRKETCK